MNVWTKKEPRRCDLCNCSLGSEFFHIKSTYGPNMLVHAREEAEKHARHDYPILRYVRGARGTWVLAGEEQ